jgi:hypothetical protein
MNAKLNTVNVIEVINGNLQSIQSFSETPVGNADATRVFETCVKENSPTIFADDLLALSEDGTFEDGNGYCVWLSHSVDHCKIN